MVKRVYVLELVEETDDEVKYNIYAVFSTGVQARQEGKRLVSLNTNNYIDYFITDYAFFE